jgi:hypothetical protein
MNTSIIYSQIIIENIIKKFLQQGQIPTLEEIENEFDQVAATQDLSSSNFTSTEFVVSRKETASAGKFNTMTGELIQDLNVLYRALYTNSQRSVELFNRWQNKSNGLENRLKGLEARIGRLLTLSADTSGYFDIVGDRFTDTRLIDLDKSSNIFINLSQNVIVLDKPNSIQASKPDRIFLNDLREDQVIFNSLTRSNVISLAHIEGTRPRFAFRDQDQYWKTHLVTSARVSPVTTELTIKLDNTITISRIDIYLHSSQSNSVTRATPMYSLDGINFNRVPAINTVAEGLDKLIFQFPETELKVLKVIFEKDNHDYVDNGLFVYEFGAREIALFKEGFLSGDSVVGTLVSKPLSVTKPDNSLVRFNKLNLEVCEGVSSESRLDYFIAVAQDNNSTPYWITADGILEDFTDIDGNDIRQWYPITPVGRTETAHPKVLDFATISTNEREDIGISFDNTATNLISPNRAFTLLEPFGAGITYTPIVLPDLAANQRYIFAKTSHKLLDLQIDLDVEVDLDSMVLWRNVGTKGISATDTTKKIRGVQAGWEFKAPFYYTTILINGSSGLAINVGNNPININNVNYTGVIGPDILTPGIHRIRIHQDYWGIVEPELDTLNDLKNADILYPFNQKLLIEGYQYGNLYPDTEEQIYQGVDRFASFVCQKISIFDMINNIEDTDYSKYAIDTDVSGTTPGGPSYCFIVNCNSSIADFSNEKFVLEFNLTDQLFSYLAFKAEFRTDNSKLTPVLDEYKIKLGF